MTSRAIWAIGVGQCVSWGVLYYAFGVLIIPIEQNLGVARWVVVGAFSGALLVSAVAAPMVGRLVDAGHGPAVMQTGGLIAACLLALSALASTAWLLYPIWAAIGLCMAAILYEPVFAIVGKKVLRAGDRLRAIATITVFGGLASTTFLPATAALVDRAGWRSAVLALAAILAATTMIVHRLSFAGHDFRELAPGRIQTSPTTGASTSGVYEMSAIFTCSSFAAAAVATNLVPALIERGQAATTAAVFAGLFGVMQLPGRLLFVSGGRRVTPLAMLAASLALQAAGLLALAGSRSFIAIAAGVTLFAGGSGLATLARPYLVLHLYGTETAGLMNGRFARAQHLARAAGPVGAAALADLTGYGGVFALLAASLAAAGILLARSARLMTAARP
jgi:hypothetical protein